MKEQHKRPHRQNAADEAHDRRPSRLPRLSIEPPPKETGPERLYRAVYMIDVSSLSPQQAAERAYEVMKDPESMRPVLDVLDATGGRTRVDLSGHRSSGIAAMAYPKLRKYLGLEPKPVRVYDVIQELAIVDEDVLDRFGVDCIEMGRGFAIEEGSWRPWILPDGTECLIPV